MKIICSKYNFANTVEYSEISPFSDERETTRDSIDLYPYLLQNGLSQISIPKKEIDENNSMYIEAGNVTLSLTNTLSGYGDVNNYLNLSETLLTDFFGYYTTDRAYTKVDIYDNDDNNLFTGVIRKQDIAFDERSSEVMNIIVRSIDKEFADYYSNKPLISFPEIPNYQFTGIAYAGLNFAYASDVIKRNFLKVTFNFQSDITHFLYDYIVAGKPYIFFPQNNLVQGAGTTLILKTGYDSFHYDVCSAYTYFNSMLLSMGWKWYFKGGICHIEKLADNDRQIHTIDYADILSHGINNELKAPITAVNIDNGEYYGNISDEIQTESRAMNLLSEDGNYYYLGGRSQIVYSSQGEFYQINEERPFRQLNWLVSQSRYGRVFFGWDFHTEKSDDNVSDKLRVRNYFGLDSGWTFQYLVKNYVLNNTLRFFPHIPSTENSAVLNLELARTTNSAYYGNGNAHPATYGVGSLNAGVYYRGNAGSGMLKYDLATLKYTPYDYYVKTPEFQANMETYITKDLADRINITVDGIISDFDKNYQISNYPYANYQSKVWTYEDVTFDILNNTTSLKLISIS